MSLRQEQIRKWAAEFDSYRDVLDTPGWRMMKQLILDNAEFYQGEINRIIRDRTIPDAEGLPRRCSMEERIEEISRLEARRDEDLMILDQIENKVRLGAEAYRTVKVPKFEEVK
jgi:hypothetical protein